MQQNQNKNPMNLRDSDITMDFQVNQNSENIFINYNIANGYNQDIYLSDVLISYENGNLQIDQKSIRCEWIKFKRLLSISNVAKPIPEGMSMMTLPSYYLNKISANSNYNGTISLSIPVMTIETSSPYYSQRTAVGIILQFGYCFYDESINILPAENLGSSIYKASYGFLNQQKILTTTKRDIFIRCVKR
jgi:hypothetical protein